MNRGTLVIEVHHGLAGLLALPGLAHRAGRADTEVVARDGTPVPVGPDGRWAPSTQAGTITVRHTAADHQLAELIAASRAAVWSAWADGDTAMPNTWVAWHPAGGLIEGEWLGDDVVVPVTWTEANGRSGEQERWLDRYRTISWLTQEHAATPTREVALTWNAGFGRAPGPEELGELAATGRQPQATCRFRLVGLPEAPLAACEALFEATNLYHGPLWAQLTSQGLPGGRAHTALSVGDHVSIDGRTWTCQDLGWRELGGDPAPVEADPVAGDPLDLPANPSGPDTGQDMHR